MPRVRRTVSIHLPVHITLAHLEGDIPGTIYEIALDPRNVVFCTCEAWRWFGHSCKRLKAFRARLKEAA
jgi:hypothetical protein